MDVLTALGLVSVILFACCSSCRSCITKRGTALLNIKNIPILSITKLRDGGTRHMYRTQRSNYELQTPKTKFLEGAVMDGQYSNFMQFMQAGFCITRQSVFGRPMVRYNGRLWSSENLHTERRLDVNCAQKPFLTARSVFQLPQLWSCITPTGTTCFC